MFVVEYTGSATGTRGPRVRDGGGGSGLHFRPMRQFGDRGPEVEYDIEVFKFKPAGCKGEDWKVVKLTQAAAHYDKEVVASLEQRAREVSKEHAQRAELWKKAKAIKGRTGVMSTSHVFKTLIADPNAFDDGKRSEVELEALKLKLEALKAKGDLKAPDLQTALIDAGVSPEEAKKLLAADAKKTADAKKSEKSK